MSVKIIRCHPSRFDALVAFVAEHNPQPEHHIGYFGLTPVSYTHLTLPTSDLV